MHNQQSTINNQQKPGYMTVPHKYQKSYILFQFRELLTNIKNIIILSRSEEK